ncbi:SDR family NAD(P)-dependent oxidoreductase [Novosphingobium sp. B1]|uniref:SDR family NAD(P)-dependent oxidoreductase n=1 Tax=Novosphingobium sp. B1 TaxID=1938756 RepID=UPI0009D80980|nr:SDR family oxidoreductase [Novosphingobium sp. B1]SMC77887.1 3-oxoacyl-[acyl-carrier protein] reductase [Novosphingobium sp. B1]
MRKLENSVAVVTGSGRGIGRELAFLLAKEGAKVVVNDLDPDAAAETQATIVAMGACASAFPRSVTSLNFAEELAEFTKETFGDVHIIVNNAGYVWNEPVHRTTDEQWEAMQAIHLTAPFRIIRAFHPLLRERVDAERTEGKLASRRIVNVASIAATRGTAGQVAYSSAKAGLFGLTRSLAKEWGSMNITVNCVAFGLVDTRLTATTEDGTGVIKIEGEKRRVGFLPNQRDALIRSIPLARAASAEEAAGGAFIFCLPEASYITGQCIEVAGGIAY